MSSAGKRTADEDAVVTQMLLRVRTLLQNDSDDEDEDLTAKSQGEGAERSSGAAARSEPGSAAGSQTDPPRFRKRRSTERTKVTRASPR